MRGRVAVHAPVGFRRSCSSPSLRGYVAAGAIADDVFGISGVKKRGRRLWRRCRRRRIIVAERHGRQHRCRQGLRGRAGAHRLDQGHVEAGLVDALQHVLPSTVAQHLDRGGGQDVVGRPAPHHLLERADVEEAVVQVCQDGVPRRHRQERSVRVDRVPGQESRARRGDVRLDVLQDLRRRQDRRRRGARVQAYVGQARGCVCRDAPLRHGPELRLAVRDVQGQAERLERLEVRVGEEDRDAHDGVGLRVQTRHLWRLWREIVSLASCDVWIGWSAVA